MDGKTLGNTLCHSAVVTAIGIGYTKIWKLALGDQTPRFVYSSARDSGMVTAYVALSIVTKDWLVEQGILPENI